jgi:hypothetical protein
MLYQGMTSLYKPLIVLFMFLPLFGCASIIAENRIPVAPVESVTSLPPDSNCSMYQGNVCVAPIIARPPDNTCSMYQGSVCVAPIVSLAPDSTCSMYQGTACVAPIISFPQ